MSETPNETPVQKPAEASAPAEQKPAGLTLKQRIELTKKKYEYTNGKGLDKVAAEEQARKDLGLPALAEADKEKAAKPNIFERIMKSKLFIALGLAALLSGKKKEEQKAELPSKEEAGLKSVLEEDVKQEVAEVANQPAAAPAQPEKQAPAPVASQPAEKDKEVLKG
ncbi:MAG: hypothetical protein ABIH35_04460 [Patescibacteria group bacterium]